ncbi:MAG: alpha/beta fold hydrolase [Actinophytocola sp.]|nr:alpha/beta fold hydrolase [Actinophytocola sp.]
MKTTHKLIGLVGGVGAAATGAAATALTLASRQRRHRDQYADEPLGKLKPDRVSTVAADDGVPLYVEEIDPADGGQPDITLIGVHGIALSMKSWHFQRRDLAGLTLPRVRQVYYDHRGHGQSGAVTHETATLEQLASDLHSVIRALAPEGPLVLMGHSVGGMTIMALAEEEKQLFADRVCGVSLIATAAGEVGARGLPKRVLSKYSPVSWGVGGIGGIAQWQPEVVEFVRAASGQLTKRAVRRLAFGDDPSPSVVEFLLEMLDVTPVGELVKFVGTVDSHDRYEVLAGLKHAHVQVIGGDADLILPFSHCERIADELPDAQLVRVNGAGHVPQLEHPEVVTSYLIDLLQLCSDTESKTGPRDEAMRGLLRRWFA